MNTLGISNTTSSFRAYLEMMRPANIVTAFADILAGYSIAVGGLYHNHEIYSLLSGGLLWLLLSTFGLYGGGVVFNDVFDAELDTEERPERPIPSGRASKGGGAVLGILLLITGVLAAYQVNTLSSIIALVIAITTIIYDSWAKHSVVAGPLFMGLCRGGNLLLGCSILPSVIPSSWYLAFFPIVYIASITLVSRGEVNGGEKKSGITALGLIIFVSLGLLALGFSSAYTLLTALPFILIFLISVIPSFFQAAFDPSSALIIKAIKRGVLSQTILDSAIAAGFGGIILGAATLFLLVISILLGRLFAVT